jgi:hypothetical protein
LATMIQRPSGTVTGSATPNRSASADVSTGHRPGKSISEWSDREAGIAAAAVVGALGLVLLLIIAGVVLYATGSGYAVTLP